MAVDVEKSDENFELNFNKLFKYSVFSLNFNRSHPEIPKDKKWFVQFVFMYGLYLVPSSSILYSTVVHEINIDLTKAVANMSLMVMYSVVTLKYVLLVYHQEIMVSLINTVRNDYAIALTLPEEEKALVVTYAKRGQWIAKIWVYISICTSLVFPGESFYLFFYYYVMGETQLVELYHLVYPEPIERIKWEPVPFLMLYGFLYYFDFFSATMYVGVVPLAPAFMLHACGQLEMLKMRMDKLFGEEVKTAEERKRRLRIIVIQLQDIYIFVEKIQTGFKLLYELTLKGTAIMLPIITFSLIDTFRRGQVSMEFIVLFWGAILLSYCPCYYGDMLIERAESFRTAVYMSGWEGVWDKRARNTILVVMTRTQRTVAIRTMFRNLCLDALTDVYHQAYAIFNFLLAAWS